VPYNTKLIITIVIYNPITVMVDLDQTVSSCAAYKFA